MDPCVICFDDMDMASYQDQRESTETCIKLDCGHSYHTKCIVRCLSQLDQKCPNCNSSKTPSKELTREGLARKLVSEIKRIDEVKFLLNEHSESFNELKSAQKQLSTDIKAYIKQRKIELQINEKRSYFMDCINNLYSTMKKHAKLKAPQFIGALQPEARRRHHYWYGSYLDEIVFGRPKARSMYRLKFPFLRIRLY
jgi:hypothetical protein